MVDYRRAGGGGYTYPNYLNDKGDLGYSEWIQAGQPKGPLHWEVKGPADLPKFVKPSTAPPIGSPGYASWATGTMTDAQKAAQALRTVTGGGKMSFTPTTPAAGGQIPLPPGYPQTWTDGEGTTWSWDSSLGQYTKMGFDPTKVYQKPPTTPRATKPFPTTPAPAGYRWEWNETYGDWMPEPGGAGGAGQVPQWRPGELEFQQKQLGQEQQQWQQQLAWQREQETGRIEAQKQERLATLRAQPASWLEYASLAGQTPAIQPWMLPLMPQEYAGMTAGQAIPGWQGLGGQPTAPSGGYAPPTQTPGQPIPGYTPPTQMPGQPSGAFQPGGAMPGETVPQPGLTAGIYGPWMSMLDPANVQAQATSGAWGPSVWYDPATGQSTWSPGVTPEMQENTLGQIAGTWQAPEVPIESTWPGYSPPGAPPPVEQPSVANEQAYNPAFKEGGQVPRTGLAKLEEGEVVLPPQIANWLRRVLTKSVPIKQGLGSQQAPSFQYGGVVTDPYGGLTRGLIQGQLPQTLTRWDSPPWNPNTPIGGAGVPTIGGTSPVRTIGGGQIPMPMGGGGLPWLTTPARQYQARMGPTGFQQYGGYERMRTGITPEELQWRLWSSAAPSGQWQGLRYQR